MEAGGGDDELGAYAAAESSLLRKILGMVSLGTRLLYPLLSQARSEIA